MNLKDLNIEDLIPHREGMRLIHEIIDVNEEMAVTQSIVNEKWPFFDGNEVNSLIIIELVAQTAGITNGWDRVKTLGLNSKKEGWIVGIKQSRFLLDKIPLHKKLITSAETRFKYDKFREVSGVTMMSENLIGEVTLQLFQAASE